MGIGRTKYRYVTIHTSHSRVFARAVGFSGSIAVAVVLIVSGVV